MLRQEDPSAAYDRAWWNNWLLKLIYRGFRPASVWWVRAVLAVRQIKLPSTSVPDTTIPVPRAPRGTGLHWRAPLCEWREIHLDG